MPYGELKCMSSQAADLKEIAYNIQKNIDAIKMAEDNKSITTTYGSELMVKYTTV